MSKHTPGPWEPSTDGHGRGRIYGGGVWLATTWLATGDGNNAPTLPAVANARLIAAAPDLLEALTNLERVSGLPSLNDDPSRVAARAAIAKAIGEQA